MVGSKQLKQLLLRKISAFLVNYGFDKKIYRQSFLCPILNGKAIIYISTVEHSADFDVIVDVGIRFDELENMIRDFMLNNNPIFSKLTRPSEQILSATIGTELGNLSEGGQKRWTVSCEEDIEGTVASIKETTINVAFPYIDKYKDIEYAFSLLIKDDEEALSHSTIHYLRAMKALGLALLLKKNSEIVNELINNKTKFLRKRGDRQIDLFIKFVEFCSQKNYQCANQNETR